MYLNLNTGFNIFDSPLWLTLTWDVFKLNTFLTVYQVFVGLTLTWDVFKWISIIF